jgi:C4-dicarboxylate transporter DctM subunit
MHRYEGVVAVGAGAFRAIPALMIPVVLLGGILSGFFTPTEAGAVAVLYTILVGSLYYRTLTWKKFADALLASAKVTASALMIVATAIVFSQFLTFYQIPQEILQGMLAVTESRVVLILLIIVFFLIVGTFMDAIANMIILGPLLMPIMVDGLGMHPIQFGMFLMVGLLLGLLTPPLGLCLFIAAPIAKASLEKTSLAVIPFLIAELIVLMLIAFIPAITLTVPRLTGFI